MTGMPKIIISCLTSASGGIDRVIENFLSSGDETLFDLHLICRDSELLFSNINSLSKVKISRYPLWKRNISYIIRKESLVIKELAELSRNHNGKVLINPHDYLSVYYSVLAKYYYKLDVFIVPTVHQLSETRPVFKGKRLLFKSLDRYFFRKVNSIIAISNQLKEILISYGLVSNKIKVIHNGVRLDFQNDASPERTNAKNLFLVPENKFVLGFAGRLSLEKGAHVFIEALSRIPDSSQKNMAVIIAGEGPMRTELERMVIQNKLTNVKFAEHVKNMKSFYSAIDVLVQPSFQEGISMTILEAMSLGIPVIASSVGGNPEVVINGKTGSLVNPGDPEMLASAILDLLENPNIKAAYGCNSRRRILEAFDIQKSTRETLEYFQSFF